VETINNFELRTKKIKYSTPHGECLDSPKDVARIANKLIGNKTQEHVIVFSTNTRNEIIGYHLAAVGGIGSCSVDMRCIFRTALIAGATGLVLSHNHPSGYLEISQDDLAITKRISDAAKILDLVLVDHVIVSETGHNSIREQRPELFK
jgi:DNA repair protein RadC